mgnify:FL=1
MATTKQKPQSIDSELLAGWTSIIEAWSSVFANTITVSGDFTSKYQKGDKVRLVHDAATKYFYITSCTHSAGTTTIVVTGGTDYIIDNSNALSSIFYSHTDNPIGFPGAFNYTPTLTPNGAMTYTSTSVSYAKFSISGRTVTLTLRFTGTVGGTPTNYISATLPITNGATQSLYLARIVDGTEVTGYINIGAGTSSADFGKANGGNFSAGAGRDCSCVTQYFI